MHLLLFWDNSWSATSCLCWCFGSCYDYRKLFIKWRIWLHFHDRSFSKYLFLCWRSLRNGNVCGRQWLCLSYSVQFGIRASRVQSGSGTLSSSGNLFFLFKRGPPIGHTGYFLANPFVLVWAFPSGYREADAWYRVTKATHFSCVVRIEARCNISKSMNGF